MDKNRLQRQSQISCKMPILSTSLNVLKFSFYAAILVQNIHVTTGSSCWENLNWSNWSSCECLPSLNMTCGGSAARWRNITDCSVDNCECPFQVEECIKSCLDNGSICYWKSYGDWNECEYEGDQTCGMGLKSRTSKECYCKNYGIADNQYCGLQHVHFTPCFKVCPDVCQDLHLKTITLSSPGYQSYHKNQTVFIKKVKSSPIGLNFRLSLIMNKDVKVVDGDREYTATPLYANALNLTHLSYYDTHSSISVVSKTVTITFCELSRDSWGNWSSCFSANNQTCLQNGMRHRKRHCFGETTNSVGTTVKTQHCYGFHTMHEFCKVPCYNWTEWKNNPCTGECGGQRYRPRTRACSADVAGYPNDSSKCAGDHTMEEMCDELCYVLKHWTIWQDEMVDGVVRRRTRNRTCFEYTSTGVQHHKPTQYCNVSSGDEVIEISAWSNRSSCSVSCGVNETVDQYRTCKYNEQETTNETLCGNLTNTLECPFKPCPPFDAMISQWSSWTQCSVSCDGGVETAERHCTPPKFGGVNCSESNLEMTRACNEHKCSGYYQAESSDESCSNVCKKYNLHCWDDFEGIKTLSQAEEQFRRFCITVKTPVQEKFYYPAINGNNSECMLHTLSGNSSFQCNNTEELPESILRICNCKRADDITYGPWTSWSDCSTSCGAGSRKRFRDCIAKTCEVPVESQAGNCGTACSIDGGWSHWGPWWECNATCGGGWKRRERICANPIPIFGGEECIGEFLDLEKCGFGICPIHGNFSEWGAWEPCNQTCGPGNQTRKRFCDNPPPQDGGADCFGKNLTKRACKDYQPCHPVTVQLKVGICNDEKLRNLPGGSGEVVIEKDSQAFRELEKWITDSVQTLYPTRSIRIKLHDAKRLQSSCQDAELKEDTQKGKSV